MRATEVVAMLDTLKRANLEIPFGLILEPESFEELGKDIEEWATVCVESGDRVEPCLNQPFRFMGLWFSRSDEPAA